MRSITVNFCLELNGSTWKGMPVVAYQRIVSRMGWLYGVVGMVFVGGDQLLGTI